MLRAESDLQLIKFSLEICATFTLLATIKYEAGNDTSAERSLTHAEGTYAALLPLIIDPRYHQYFTGETVQGFMAQVGQLRERLDGLQQFRK